jgi:hypothetical protein
MTKDIDNKDLQLGSGHHTNDNKKQQQSLTPEGRS